MRIGIFFNARRSQGGLYQYALRLLECLHRFGPGDHGFVVFVGVLDEFELEIDRPNWKVVRLPRIRLLPRLAAEYGMMQLARAGWRWPLPLLPAYPEVEREKIDLMLYVKPGVQCFLWPYRAVFPVHDLQHLLQPEWPEYQGGEARRREYVYRNAVPKAAATLADSETGRQDVLNAYHPRPDRVQALPHLAPTHFFPAVTGADLERVRARYSLPGDYLFYGAVFWPHKNHARLVRAIRILKEGKGFSVPLLLAGGSRLEYPKIVALVKELGLGDQVRFLGYVPDEDMYPLYRLARMLVMPTFFGPSNIPYLEAWANDCPVLTSNMPGLPEQVGEAGVTFDPRSEQAIADAIWKVYNDAGLRARMIAAGRAKVAEWTPDKYAQRLFSILRQAALG